jgi:4-carboxymuconolactone decarboxylase
MARIPAIKREDLPEDQRHHYDYVAGSRPTVSGPFPILLNSPDVAERIAHVGTYLRFNDATLEPTLREVAILTVARFWDCQYEWTAHQRIAEATGTRPEAIAAIRENTAPARLTEQEALIHNYAKHLLTGHRVPKAVYEPVAAWLGRQGIVDLTATVGYYSLLACNLNAFEVMPAPDEGPGLLPGAVYGQ